MAMPVARAVAGKGIQRWASSVNAVTLTQIAAAIPSQENAAIKMPPVSV